jgi:hypothetical protein
LKPKTPEICPVCGEDVPRGALACPECGADHNSGWREDADSIDADGESDFDYDEYVEREFGNSPKPAGVKPVWWITAIVLLAAFIAFYALAKH